MTTGIHQQDEVDPNGRPNSLAEMTADGRIAYKQDWDEFVYADREYKEHMKALRELTNWVLTSISPSIQETTLLPGKNLKEWYEVLARSGKVYEQRLMTDVQREYRQHLTLLPKQAKKFDEWVQKWQETMARGQHYQVPETMSAQTWSNDLIQAVATVMETWSTNFRMNKRTAIQDGSLTYQEVGSDLLDEWTTIHGRRGKAFKGGFLAWHGEEAEPTEDEIHVDATPIERPAQEPSQQPRSRGRGGNRSRGGRGRGRGGNKHQRTDSREVGSKCRACLQFHDLADCFYVFKQKKPKGFNLNPLIVELVAARLKADPDLEKEVKQHLKKMGKELDD
ncbi:hypothetical protein MFIFM68171_09713 [Madurella fahalii]|uniref:Gag protein n=1 Tax=Madurella fahalii TaxID=1157608 RepID=A0ABQ0GP43_9PEZI